MLAYLMLADYLADAQPDAGGLAQRSLGAARGGDDRVKQFLGGPQQLLAGAGPLGG